MVDFLHSAMDAQAVEVCSFLRAAKVPCDNDVALCLKMTPLFHKGGHAKNHPEVFFLSVSLLTEQQYIFILYEVNKNVARS